MQNFIVLGYIPGTSYQTTLTFWLMVSAVFACALFLPQLYFGYEKLRRNLTLAFIAFSISHAQPLGL